MDSIAEAFGSFLEQQIEPVPVGIVEKDVLSRIPTQDYVIVCTWIVDEGFSCDGGTIGQLSNISSLIPVRAKSC
jgi:hypothetical protein